MKIDRSVLTLLAATTAATAAPLFADAPKDVSVIIKTLPAQMRYDTERIIAEPGAKISITLDNADDLPHNVVVCQPKAGGNDKGMDVALAAWNLGEAGMTKQWIPENPRIIAHTPMVDPHQKGSLTFTAPEAEGEYPYVCTFPGHAMVMNGLITVAKAIPPIRNLHFRYYTGDFKALPDFSKLTPLAGGPLPAGKCDIALNKEKGKFAYEFEGALDCPREGEYKFVLGGDDGVRLFIDGNEVINQDGIHPFNLKEKKIKLTKGEHKVLAHYFQGGGEAEFFLAWSGPGFKETPLSEWVPNTDRRETDEQKYQGMPLVVNDEALIYRNFIKGSSPRGIAVGYPGGVNLCWDADQMNLDMVWQGAFMDAKRHWTGRGAGDQPPLGYDVAALSQTRSLAVLDSGSAPWVSAYKKEEPRDPAYRFLGYELDGKRQPTFKWQFKEVQVEEKFQPNGDYKSGTARLKRTVTLTAKAPVNGLHFLALSGGNVEIKGKDFVVDKVVKFSVEGAEPVVRKEGGRTEVMLPVEFKDGKAELSFNYAWNAR
ncbi:MAG TPA: PA14 domain-containing protein [Verrucomicrobium sp.]|nr:PA14 domain-containing protein [Verrucomicrobium sp.]